MAAEKWAANEGRTSWEEIVIETGLRIGKNWMSE
jgi:hypothetical protein